MTARIEAYGDSISGNCHKVQLVCAQLLSWIFFEQYSHEPYIAGKRYSIADIALYAYTHKAHEGGFSLVQYPNVRQWLKRVVSQPGYIPMSERH